MTFLLQCLLELRTREPSQGLRDASLLKTDDSFAAPGSYRRAGPPMLTAVPAGATTAAMVRDFVNASRGPICRNVRSLLPEDHHRPAALEREV
jgi:hypothetical protein